MVGTANPLRAQTARGLMSREVVFIPQYATLEVAARMLAQAKVSGAPVVDGQGRCVGVLSATDFVRCFEKNSGVGVPGVESDYFCDWQMFDFDLLPPESVRVHMTPDPVTVALETPIQELARMMVDAHIHRLIVVDGQRRPVGVVSTMDIMAAVAQADAE